MASAIILIEGVDKTGKTTEAERLKVELEKLGPVKLIHFGVPQGNPFQDYRTAILDADRFHGSTIIDRLHWSNLAYQTVFRNTDGADAMSQAQVSQLDRLFDAVGGSVILKLRDPKDVVGQIDAEDYKQLTYDNCVDLQRIFLDCFLRANLSSARLVDFGKTLSDQFLGHFIENRAITTGAHA